MTEHSGDFQWKDGVTLREYFEAQLEAHGRHVCMVEANLIARFEAKIAAIEKAVSVADNSMNKRLEGMNEFRDALKDQTAKFVTKAEIDAVVDRIQQDIRELLKAKAIAEGKASQTSVTIATGISVLGIGLGLGSLLIAILRGG